MQTSFSPAQLSDPLTARSNRILRTCVHCGFCTATCPTYQVLGDELDSPRGRIYLIKEMLESGRPADEKTVTHIDRCLGCLSCMTTCPSGVHYAHLLEHAREHIERTYRRPPMDRLLRWVLRRILPHPGRFRLALAGARLARPLRGLMPDRRLRAMLDMAPRRVPAASRNDRGQTFPAQGPRRARVALMIGCAQRALNTDINDATIRLLQRAGVEVVIPEAFGCCGALTLHMGQEADGRARARDSIRRLLAAEAQGPLDAIIVNTSGCGTTIKDYGHLFKGDPLEPEARRAARLARDVTEFLVDLGLPAPTRAPAPHAPAPASGRPAGAEPGAAEPGTVGAGAAAPGAVETAAADPGTVGRSAAEPGAVGMGAAETAAAAPGAAAPAGPPSGGPGPVAVAAPGPIMVTGAGTGPGTGAARRGVRVAYHSACSLQHGQQVRSAPKDLLASLGFIVVEPADPHLCCGSAGTYNLLQPELSSELKSRKVATLEALAPDVIAAGNIGCMMQIGGGTGVPVVHTVELLDWATGGPRPRAMGA